MFGRVISPWMLGHADWPTAAIGGTFEFTRIAAANLREKEDAYNQAIGGFFAGGIVGFRRLYFMERRRLIPRLMVVQCGLFQLF